MTAVVELKVLLDTLLATARAETADIDLFAPIPEREECPLCMILLPIDELEIRFVVCCGKSICLGCLYKHMQTETKKGVPKGKQKCAFCCQPTPKNFIKPTKKLMKRDNRYAYMDMALRHKLGDGVIQSETKALVMYIRAAELGHCDAYGSIGHYYGEGIAPVEQDKSKELEYYKIAAKKGSIEAHQRLASLEVSNCVSHMKVAAGAGDQSAMNDLMKFYKLGLLPKEALDQSLRAFQASNDAMKSEDRDVARAACNERILERA